MADRELNFHYKEPERVYVPSCVEVAVAVVGIILFFGWMLLR